VLEMSDKIPGSSWSNPIWYRDDWRIYADDVSPYPYAFVHDDYDGATDGGDTRYGHGKSVADCETQIDEWIEDNEQL
jgi:hypothetical protein